MGVKRSAVRRGATDPNHARWRHTPPWGWRGSLTLTAASGPKVQPAGRMFGPMVHRPRGCGAILLDVRATLLPHRRPSRRLRCFGLALTLALVLVPAVAVGSAQARHASAVGRGYAYLNYYAPFYYMLGNSPGGFPILCDDTYYGQLRYRKLGYGSCHQGLNGTQYTKTSVKNLATDDPTGILSYWCDYTGCG